MGELGVFAVDDVNGAVLAIPNSGSPVLEVSPLGTSGDEHNARVHAYFVNAGIPSEQIGSVSIHPLLGRGGAASLLATSDSFQPKLIAYYSVLNRVYGTIPVADSVAWARFNIDDQVVSETVYWPEIPASVLADARALQDAVSTPDAFQAFRSTLPGDLEGGGTVVIRHSSHTWRERFAPLHVMK